MLTVNKIRKIVEKIDACIPIVVEGKKDKAVLIKLGFKNIIEISGKSLFKIPNLVGDSESVVILTDFDEEGRKKALQLKTLFTHSKIKVDTFARKMFGSLGIHKIEELNSFTKFMEDDYYGKTCSIYDKISGRGRVHNRRNGRKARCNWSDIRPD